MSEIKNKVVIITEASNGLSEATALRLAKSGSKLMLAARHEDRLKELVAAIAKSGGSAATELITTVSDKSTVDNVNKLYAIAIDADAIARMIAKAIEQPRDVDVNEMIIRPTKQDL